jgi:repressor LexA
MAYSKPGQTREKVFRLVRERILAGLPPTVREVQRAFGFQSVQTAREHLDALVAEGRLRKEPGRSRGFRLPFAAGAALVPLLGQVQAGALTTAIENPEGYLPVSPPVAGSEIFALRVRGESMTGAGILPGDIAIVRRQPTANHGEIVVAMADDEATVKRLRFRRGRAELHPENPAFPVLTPDPRALVILGKVIEVRRYFEEPAVVEASS